MLFSVVCRFLPTPCVSRKSADGEWREKGIKPALWAFLALTTPQYGEDAVGII